MHPVHPPEGLQQAVQRDEARVAALELALEFRQGGDDCPAELSRCTGAMSTGAQAERAFDEAPYLADLETPYRGESVSPSRIWTPAAGGLPEKCPASLLALRQLAGRASEQQARRLALQRDYISCIAWAKAAEDRRIVGEREAKKAELRQQKATLIIDAELRYQKALQAATKAREVASEAVAQNPAGAQELVTRATEAQAELEASDRNRVDARLGATSASSTPGRTPLTSCWWASAPRRPWPSSTPRRPACCWASTGHP